MSYTPLMRQNGGFSHHSSAKPTLKGEHAALFPLTVLYPWLTEGSIAVKCYNNLVMLEKIKTIYKDPRWRQLRDVRVIGLIVFAVIVLLVSWSSVAVIQTNYELQKQISQFDEQNRVQQLENDNQKLKNQYYNTDQYLELQARRSFGKAAPGETLVIVPREVALSKIQPLPETKEDQTQEPNKPTYQKNFEAWRDFFLHRS